MLHLQVGLRFVHFWLSRRTSRYVSHCLLPSLFVSRSIAQAVADEQQTTVLPEVQIVDTPVVAEQVLKQASEVSSASKGWVPIREAARYVGELQANVMRQESQVQASVTF